MKRKDDPALYRAAERLLERLLRAEYEQPSGSPSRWDYPTAYHRRALRLIREALLAERTARLWRWTKDCASIHRKDRTEIARLRRRLAKLRAAK